MLEMNLAVDESWPTSCIQNGGDYFIAILLKLGRIVVWGFLGLGLLGFFELVAFDLAVKIIVMRQN